MIRSATVTIAKVWPGTGGGAVCTGYATDGELIRFLCSFDCIFRAPVEGEVWAFEGNAENHPKFGNQVRIASAVLLKPSGKLIVDYLCHHPAFRGIGIGRAKAERLWDCLGEDLYGLLGARNLEKLRGVLTDETAGKLVDAWETVAKEADVIAFLSHHGFDTKLANKVRTIWPEDTVQKLQDNPYRMLVFSSWHKVDAAAMALGVPPDDERRQIAAVEHALYVRLDEKHTVTPSQAALADTREALGPGYEHLAEGSLQKALSQAAIVQTSTGVSPLGASVMEKAVTRFFDGLLARNAKRQLSLFHDLEGVVAETILEHQQKYEIKLNPEQVAGVNMALQSPVGIVTGGAGVGKTALLRAVFDAHSKMGGTVWQMALSGRAAQVLRDATGGEAMTIAKFLHDAAKGVLEWAGDLLVVIDESSMLDLATAYRLSHAIPAEARLLLIGDAFQLPPIGFGLIFHVLVNSARMPRITLTEVHRQAQATGIPQLAHEIRAGRVPALSTFTGPGLGVSFIEAAEEEILANIVSVAESLAVCPDVQILSALKKGGCGTKNINRVFHEMRRGGKTALEKWHLAEGDPVVFLHNDYERSLWKGSLV